MIERFRALPPKPLCVNRSDELKHVRDLADEALASGAPILLAISGGAGIGKSVLLRELAYELGERYPAIAYHAATSTPVQATDGPVEIATDLLVQLGVPWKDLPEPELRCSVLRSLVERARPLLALDNIDDAAQVLPLLGDVRQAAVLVAGRRRLEALTPAGFVQMRLRGFEIGAGVELVRTLGGAAVAESDPAVLSRLVQVCGGVPQLLWPAALRIAEGYEPAADYVTRLERSDTLDQIVADLDIDDRPVVVAVCDASYESLSAEEARAYLRLSQLPGRSFDIPFAVAVLDRPEPMVKRIVQRLIDKSLLQPGAGGYVEFPLVMRQHALGLARSVQSELERSDLEKQAIGWCAQRAVGLALSMWRRPIPAPAASRLFDDSAAAYGGANAIEQACAEFAARWATLVAAVWRALELGLQAEALILLSAMWPFAYQTERTLELADAYDNMIPLVESRQTVAAELDDPATRFQLYRDIAALYERRSDFDQAFRYVDLAAAAGYEPGSASILEWRAIVEEGRGNLQAALADLDQARAAVALLADLEHEERSHALIDMHCGRIKVKLGLDDESEPELLAALHYFQGHERDGHNVARCLELLGGIAHRRGEYEKAVLYLSEALDAMMRYGSRSEAVVLHDKLAGLADDHGRPDIAADHREKAQRLRQPE